VQTIGYIQGHEALVCLSVFAGNSTTGENFGGSFGFTRTVTPKQHNGVPN
jgi:hypothetical protein